MPHDDRVYYFRFYCSRLVTVGWIWDRKTGLWKTLFSLLKPGL